MSSGWYDSLVSALYTSFLVIVWVCKLVDDVIAKIGVFLHFYYTSDQIVIFFQEACSSCINSINATFSCQTKFTLVF